LSEIIESIPDITKEEIDHLRSSLQDYGLINVRESNLGNPDAIPGTDSVQYDTYDPAVLQTRMIIESEMKENNDGLKDFLGLTNNVSSFGYKYVVVRCYWISKKKIGKLIYLDELGNEQSMLVDENYKKGTIPTEQSLEWGWINQWYQGVKIGPDIYHIKPFKLLNYCPIIGVVHEVKNTEAKSLVDLMKPFQVLYNVCMNQLYKLLEKEVGKVYLTSIRHIPIPKDGDAQDALDIWEMEARNRGVMFIDDSPENLKSPSSFNQFRDIDLTRTQEIQSRYNLAMQLKQECWELIGMSKQRLGSVSASETATGTNTAITQSYSQTEPLFVAHEYVLGQLYQAIIDASLYIESKKPQSTISYITSEGESAFVQVNGTDLKFRDLKVFLTNRPEDKQMFNEIRGLSQAVLQNGGSLHDIIELYSTNSVRDMKKVFKTLKERQEQLENQKMEQQQQQIEQQKQIAEAQMQQATQLQQEKIAHDDYQNELDRLNKIQIAMINAESKAGPLSDVDTSGTADVLEIDKLLNEQSKAQSDYRAKMADIDSKSKLAAQKLQVEREKLQVARENQANDLAIAKENAKGRAKKSK
jgi:stress response protein YsnF